MDFKKVIIMDIDGTLTNSKKQIPEKTRAALIEAEKQGARLVLASGRPTMGMTDFAQELEMDKYGGLLVCFNGARVVDFASGKVLYDKTMTVNQGQAILEHVKQFDVIPMIVKEDYTYVNNVYNGMLTINGQEFNIINYEAHNNKYKLCEIDDLAAFADFPLNKVLLAGEADYLANHFEEIAAPFKGQVNSMFTAPFYYEFTAQGIDKAKALDSVLRPMGYDPAEMLAFGDGQNDASMVEYVGTGVAMENAVAELKAVADNITASNEEDGIALELAKYFKL